MLWRVRARPNATAFEDYCFAIQVLSDASEPRLRRKYYAKYYALHGNLILSVKEFHAFMELAGANVAQSLYVGEDTRACVMHRLLVAILRS